MRGPNDEPKPQLPTTRLPGTPSHRRNRRGRHHKTHNARRPRLPRPRNRGPAQASAQPPPPQPAAPTTPKAVRATLLRPLPSIPPTQACLSRPHILYRRGPPPSSTPPARAPAVPIPTGPPQAHTATAPNPQSKGPSGPPTPTQSASPDATSPARVPHTSCSIASPWRQSSQSIGGAGRISMLHGCGDTPREHAALRQPSRAPRGATRPWCPTAASRRHNGRATTRIDRRAQASIPEQLPFPRRPPENLSTG